MTRYARVRVDGAAVHARVDDEHAHLLSAAPWCGGEETGRSVARADAALLCPVDPRKIVCVGRNYAAHAAELGNEVPGDALLFFKPSSSLIGPGDAIRLPPASMAERVDHEAELGLVIGKAARHVRAEDALDHVFGLTIVGDITARDLQKREKQWARAKGMDTFCPVGPEVVTGVDPNDLRIRCWVGDDLRQDGSTALMVRSCAELIATISEAMTLEPGDLIATGTPAGVGPLRAGAVLRIAIDGIGELSVHVEGHDGEGG